jgi:hypothetical protein
MSEEALNKHLFSFFEFARMGIDGFTRSAKRVPECLSDMVLDVSLWLRSVAFTAQVRATC